ncbi:aspartate beta-hydroxylase [Elysia marginata]|uniref:Aspartate beta-hydroxylase n=1 Tax=Elysia marginata TaxID=1093978 RepID=A0AAV4F785_9GAST|nr:aspartate beta-hydroxylase [Elysia marginata]
MYTRDSHNPLLYLNHASYCPSEQAKHLKARGVYQAGEDKSLFLSAWQRSLYNVDGLTSRPWWTVEQTGYTNFFKALKENWKAIRDEGLAQLNAKTGAFQPEDENLRDTGDWKQFTLFQQGRKNKANCEKAPKTCALIEQFPSVEKCTRGQVKFSVMSPGIHVWPHTGPTNCRIRSHLGLVVPQGPLIRVMNETRKWKEGEVLIFDDSFEHEVWHEGSELRLVLIVDVWHPELTQQQRRTLSPI